MLKLGLLLTITLAVAPAAITVKHIDGTTTAYAEDQLQNAIDDPLTVCGDIIEVDPGGVRHNVYPYYLRGPALSPALGGPTVPPSYAKDCASSGKYITIRSSKAYQLTPGKRAGSADAANLAFFGMLPDLMYAGIGCTVFETQRAASYWRLQGLEMAAAAGDCSSGGAAILKITYSVYTGASGLSRMDHFPNHIIVDQCWIHGLDGYPVRDGAQLEGISISLTNSTIDNIRTPDSSGQESHSIVTVSGRGPLRVVNNKLSSGKNDLMFGGAVPPTKRPMEDVSFIGNWFYRPYKWMDWYGTTDPTPSSPCPLDSDGHGATYRNTSAGTYWECQGAAPGTWTQLADGTTYTALTASRIPGLGKNILELKSASRVLFEGNLLDQASSLNEVGQFGTCFQFSTVSGPTSKVSHIRIENNLCQHAGWGFIQGQDITYMNPDNETRFWDDGGHSLNHILFHNNLFRDMGEDMTTDPPFGVLDNFQQSSGFASVGHGHGDAITVNHSTFEGRLTRGYSFITNIGIRSDAPFDATLPSLNQRVTNSIWTAGKCPVGNGEGRGCDVNAISDAWGPYAEIAANGLVDNLGIGITSANLDATLYHCVPGTRGCAYTADSHAYPPNCLNCQFKTPTEAKFASYPDDLTLQSDSPFKGKALDGKDLGADLNIVGWATGGAQAGTLAPYLAMKIRAVVPAATSAQVRFSAIDTSSCSVEARKYGFPLSTPAATVTDNTGTIDRVVTLTGLSGNTKYGLKVTCAGTYYRDDEFRTP